MPNSANTDAEITGQRLKIFQRLKTDLPFYCKHCLKIPHKSGETTEESKIIRAGEIVPFVFNRAQRYLHERLEEQRKRTGRVRAVVVKGRQQGCSTYVTARFFHQTSLTSGVSTFILAHISDSTHYLFKMVGRFYDNAPEEIKPAVKVSNQKNLEFEGLHSEYSIGTAGSADIGRSMTIQKFHGSECAFWPNTDDIMTGVLQGVADAPGTEIIFESTAKGMGNLFHKLAMIGLNPESDFMTVFLPWFWQDEYQKPLPVNFSLTEEEVKLRDIYKLTDAQLYWRRRKIQDAFGGEVWKFQREYPCSIQEAFITSGETLVPGEVVAKARVNKTPDPIAPLIMGVDPARSGDRTVIVFRRGRQLVRIVKYATMDEMTLAGIIGKFLDSEPVQKCFIDVGMGYGTIDALRQNGYGTYVTGIHFGSTPMQPDIYLNKRAEMYDDMQKWFMDGGVSIPDDDELVSDIMAIPPLEQTTGRGVLTLRPKEKIIEEYGKSPDIADALALTFAFPVNSGTKQRIQRKEAPMSRTTSPLSTIKRFTRGARDNQSASGTISFI
jgi:hypothetical protein